jgi:ATP-dependent protease ClpP protease subunit
VQNRQFCRSSLTLTPYRDVHPIERALERDHFMTAKEALSFGIIDKIVERRPAPTSSDADGAGKDKQ